MNMRQKKKFKKKLSHKKWITSKILVKIQKAVMGISKDCLFRFGIDEERRQYEEMAKRRQEMFIEEQMRKRLRDTYGLFTVEIDLAEIDLVKGEDKECLTILKGKTN